MFHFHFKDEINIFGRKNGETSKYFAKSKKINLSRYPYKKEDIISIELNEKYQYFDEFTKENIGNADLIFLCVETIYTTETCLMIKELIKKDCCIVSLQNGLDSCDTISKTLTEQYIVPSVIFFNIVRKQESNVLTFHNGTKDRTLKLPTTTFDNKKLPEKYVEYFKKRSIKDLLNVEIINDIRGHQYHKIIINLNNSINMVSGKPYIETVKDPNYRRIFSDMITETLEVYKKKNIDMGTHPLRLNPRLLSYILYLPNFIFLRFAKSAIGMNSYII
jgi:2-dehydropantoate 2-reductase